MNTNKYMEIAIKEALKAEKNGDVPIGAVVVKNGKIIGKGHNRKETKKNAVFHAEVLAISKACKKNKSWHLDDCELYCTMEPCMMCCGAIIQSRIKKVFYMVKNTKFGCTQMIKNSKIKFIVLKENEQMKKILNGFFIEKRK